VVRIEIVKYLLRKKKIMKYYLYRKHRNDPLHLLSMKKYGLGEA
jgi:hypothetical protein